MSKVVINGRVWYMVQGVLCRTFKEAIAALEGAK